MLKSSATTLSVLNLGDKDYKSERRGTLPDELVYQASNSVKTIPGIILAVGRRDGRLLLYDIVGRLQQEVKVDQNGGRVIDVEWVAGPRPPALEESDRIDYGEPTAWIDLYPIGGSLRARVKPDMRGAARRRTQAAECRRSKLVALRDLSMSPKSPRRPVSNMPMDDAFDTVKHQKINGPIRRDLPAVDTLDNYRDLLTRTKRASQPSLLRSPARRTSTHPRPRVTSTTFRQHADHSRSLSEGVQYDRDRTAPVSEKLRRSVDAARRYIEDEAMFDVHPKSAWSRSVCPRSASTESSQSPYVGSFERRSSGSGSAASVHLSASSPSMTGPISLSSSVDTVVPLRNNGRHASIADPDHAGKDGAGRVYFEGGRADRERFYSAIEFLPPGFAQSYHGPVEVERYLPRRSSKSSGSAQSKR